MNLSLFSAKRKAVLVCDGDSHTAETVPGAGHGMPSKVLPRLVGAPLLGANIAVSGASGFHSGYDVFSSQPRIAWLLIGTNNYIAHASAATVSGLVDSRATTLRGLGFKVVAIQCFPCSSISGADETARVAGKALIAALASLDGVVDLESSYPTLTAANLGNGTFGNDGIHMHEAGCEAVAPAIATTFNTILRTMT